jgi:hypothetical protein
MTLEWCVGPWIDGSSGLVNDLKGVVGFPHFPLFVRKFDFELPELRSHE